MRETIGSLFNTLMLYILALANTPPPAPIGCIERASKKSKCQRRKLKDWAL